MSTDPPRVSIIVPVYNGSRFLSDALDSAIAQTYQSLEIIIVDDGSDDEGATFRIAKAYASAHDHVSYFHQVNQGVGAALNAGIAVMRGELFCWLSHDDRYEPTKTEEQVAFFDRLADRNAMIFSDWMIIDESGNEIGLVALDHRAFLQKPLLALVTSRLNGGTMLCHKSVIEAAGGFEVNCRYTQDYYLWAKLRHTARFCHMAKPLLQYREHADQCSHLACAVEEGEIFWIHLMSTMSRYEKASVAGNSREFFKLINRLLAPSPYVRAAATARDRMLALAENSRISVILTYQDDPCVFKSTIEQLALQYFRRLELVVAAEKEPPIGQISEKHGLPSWRYRVVPASGDVDDQIRKAILYASSEYVTVVDRNSIGDPSSLIRQLLEMQRAQARVSRMDISVSNETEGVVRWMIHAAIIEEGTYWPLTRDCAPGRDAHWVESAETIAG